jgi:hypothetical protein
VRILFMILENLKGQISPNPGGGFGTSGRNFTKTK